MEMNDSIAIYNRGCDYFSGESGLPQDYDKAIELWHRAGELGCTDAYFNIGNSYANGEGVEVDQKKEKHYYELAAMGGHVDARHNLGIDEENADNIDRAIKHFMIAVRDGDADSLQRVQQLHSNGNATKEDYIKALQSYQTYLDEIESDQRDEAAAADDEYKYIGDVSQLLAFVLYLYSGNRIMNGVGQ